MGIAAFVRDVITPILFATGDKTAAAGVSLRPEWTFKNVIRATEANALRDALMDVRTEIRGREVNVTHFGATGNGQGNDATAIQAAIDAVSATSGVSGSTLQGYTINVGTVVFPTPSTYYLTTAAINVSSSYVTLRGASPGVRIVNGTDGATVISVHKSGGGSDVVFSPRIENLSLKGTGSTSKALHLDCVWGAQLTGLIFDSHPGTAIYLDSSGSSLTGCASTTIDCCQFWGPGTATTAIHDIKSMSTTIKRSSFMYFETGVQFEYANSPSVEACTFDNIVRGTVKTAIKATAAAKLSTSNSSIRRALRVSGCRFENVGADSIYADSSVIVLVENVQNSAGVYSSTTNVATGVLRLNGGGRVDGLNGATGTAIRSSDGLVEVSRSTGFYGLASQIRVAGTRAPFESDAVNKAVNPWFDSAPSTGNVGAAANPVTWPVVAHDTGGANGFLGKSSAQITFQGGHVGGVSHIRFESMALAGVNPPTPCNAIIAFKCDREGEGVFLRQISVGGGTFYNNVTCEGLTDWQIAVLSDTPVNNATTCVFWVGICSGAVDVPGGGINWHATHTYAANSYVSNDSGKLYHTVAGGTSGNAGGPTGAVPAADGSVAWDYVRDCVAVNVWIGAVASSTSGAIALVNTDRPTLALAERVAVPASAAAPGRIGEWAAVAGTLYVCVAVDTWQKVTIATW